jgi:plastocyanin
MKSMHRWQLFPLGFALLALSNGVNAARLVLQDSAGNPIRHGVVAIPSETTEWVSPPENIAPAVMDQIDKQFVPEILRIQRGQEVSFPNSDDIHHHVYSFSSPKTFEIKLYSGSEASPVLFDKPGIVVLGCNIHDQMVGYLYIQGQEQTWESDENGVIDMPAYTGEVLIWHPSLSHQHTERLTQSIKLLDGSTQTLTIPLFDPYGASTQATHHSASQEHNHN